MKKLIFMVLILLASNALSFAAEQPPGKLQLRANVITYDRTSGDIMLDGDVVVTRTTEGEELTVRCQHMEARVVDEQLQTVLATGNVTMHTAEYDASSSRATFDFDQNIIVLYGDGAVPARVASRGIISTGPRIIYHMDRERVELPDGGDTMIDIRGSSMGGQGNGRDAKRSKDKNGDPKVQAQK